MTDLDDLERRAQKLNDDSHRLLCMILAETAAVLRKLYPNKRRPWLVPVLEEVCEEQDGNCWLCGEALTAQDVSVHHKIAFCYGGGNERSNIQLAHLLCNQRSGTAVDPHDLLRYLEDKYINRPPRAP